MSEEVKPEQPNVATFDFGKKKKKKKPQKKEEEKEQEKKVEEKAEKSTTETTPSTTTTTETPKENLAASAEKEKETPAPSAAPTSGLSPAPAGLTYTYEELANRIFSLINSSRPEEKTVYKMKPPVVYREGTQKTVWVNFPEICKIMNRQPEHVLSFVLAEVGSTGSIDGSGRLVIKGKFQPKHIENILRHYISEYVKCHTCKSPETHLKKENRLLFMVCEKCGSSRSVTAIKSGFQATTRASRRQDAKNK